LHSFPVSDQTNVRIHNIKLFQSQRIQFLPRHGDATQSAVLLKHVVCPSVRPSVRDVEVS